MEKFVDLIRLSLRAGHGGRGAVSFRREKYAPWGGPDGGDGGRGGHVVLHANRQLSSFAHLYMIREVAAKDGEGGGGKKCHGADGENAVIPVPVGAVLKDGQGRILHDFLEDGEDFVFLKGGLGGKGNAHFANSVNQAPRYAQKGLPGEEADVILEMKLIADMGLVGLPNAGKSTFISAVTNARPKIGPYPFTTLSPNLGIFQLDSEKSLVIADIPGIIEGAHEGKGLGLEFLRHIERTRFLFFLIDASGEDPHATYRTLLNELSLHSESLPQKPFAIGISKIDLLGDAEDFAIAKDMITQTFPEDLRSKLVFFSSAARSGLEEIRKMAYEILERPAGQPD